MSKRAVSLLVTLSLILGFLGNVLPAQAAPHSLREGTDEAASIFDPLRPFQISVIRPLGGHALTHDYLDSPTYRRATVKITFAGGKKFKVFQNVGIRLKGATTRKYQKASFKIKFDAFVKSQRFKGLKRLTLNAMMTDPSQVHEVTAYRLFRAAGVPAPRAGFARVSIDGSYVGLFLNL
jgi:spore coat protein CotH